MMQAGERAAHERGEDRHKHEPDDDRGGDEAKAALNLEFGSQEAGKKGQSSNQEMRKAGRRLAASAIGQTRRGEERNQEL